MDAEESAILADLVEENLAGAVVVRHHQIGVAVVVEVAKSEAARDLGDAEQRQLLDGNLAELARALVFEEVFALVVGVGVAGPLEFAQGAHRAVDEEDVEVAVVFGVDRRHTEASIGPADGAEAGLGGSVDKKTAAVVAVEGVGFPGEVRHEEFFVAIAVEIARHHAHAGFRHSFGVHRRAA